MAAKKKFVYDASKKTKPVISNAEFLANAESVILTVNGQPVELHPRAFSTGSVGFNLSGKFDLLVNGKVVKFQGSFNLIMVGSKPAEVEKDVA